MILRKSLFQTDILASCIKDGLNAFEMYIPAVWVQDDLLKLLEAMKVALPQKDLTKYKTSESHLDWQKVAFNSYTAEMCKQKWQEVSKEVRLFISEIFTE